MKTSSLELYVIGVKIDSNLQCSVLLGVRMGPDVTRLRYSITEDDVKFVLVKFLKVLFPLL